MDFRNIFSRLRSIGANQKDNSSEQSNQDSLAGNNLPDLISKNISDIQSISRKFKEAQDKAEEAKNYAEEAGNMKTGLFRRDAPVLEALQKSGDQLAMAIVSHAEALKILFDGQTRLAKISECLFKLGISNAGQTRAIIRELEMQFSSASNRRTLDEITKYEILNLIQQLKMQEDILSKQERLSQNIDKIEDINAEQDQRIKVLEETDKRHDAQLADKPAKGNIYHVLSMAGFVMAVIALIVSLCK